MVDQVKFIFMTYKASDRREDNTNLWQRNNGSFYNEYWKADCKDI